MKLSKMAPGDLIKTDTATVTIKKDSYDVTFNQGVTVGSEAASAGPILVPRGPAGANVEANENKASSMWPSQFKKQVQNGGPWDYKQQGPEFEAFGNFNYGATGKAAGFPGSILLQEAGRAQQAAGTSLPQWGRPGIRLLPFTGSGNYGDDPADQFWIQQGIRYESN